ncbi:MAG: hypothetical protein AAFW95_06750, partial [Cyanobacteria bacterium J06638_6]
TTAYWLNITRDRGSENRAKQSPVAIAISVRPTKASSTTSQYAVVATHDGGPTLMFRAANKRRNRILEARLWVTLVRDEITAEGEFFRRFYDLTMVRAHTPLFALSWTAMHAITPESPLYGETAASLAAVNGEIIIILTGIDETLSQTIHARHSFLAEEILWDHRFVDILGQTPDGRRSIDYGKFHRVKPLEKI